MVSIFYIGAVAVYFLVLYPYIIHFISWAVWAIEGLPPPSYQKDFVQGRLVPAPAAPAPSPAPASDARSRMREEVRRMAKKRSGEEREHFKKDCPLSRSKSWLKGYCSTRRTRLDQIMIDAKAAEEGQSAHMEVIDLGDTHKDASEGTASIAACAPEPLPSSKGKERAWSPQRSFAVQPARARLYHGVELAVYVRVVVATFCFHAIFLTLPFWFRFMNYPFAQQMMRPLNMYDQD